MRTPSPPREGARFASRARDRSRHLGPHVTPADSPVSPRPLSIGRMTKLGFCILYTPDVEKKVAFYERAFGMKRKMIVEGGGFGEMKGDVPLGFVSEALAKESAGEFTPARPGSKPGAGEIGFITDDVDAFYERAVDAGAVAHKPPAKKPWGQIVAYVRDCDGALVEICTPW